MLAEAIFAAGCFWGVQDIFDKLPGVMNTEVGYCGGTLINPSYEQVCTGKTGHAESLRIEYDPDVISYEKLLTVFWQSHNPTTLNRQGPDVGAQYRSAIFYLDESQKEIAEHSKASWQQSPVMKGRGKIVTEITKATPFYKAEEYHQHYHAKHGSSDSCPM